jgi:hypothetical protein
MVRVVSRKTYSRFSKCLNDGPRGDVLLCSPRQNAHMGVRLASERRNPRYDQGAVGYSAALRAIVVSLFQNEVSNPRGPSKLKVREHRWGSVPAGETGLLSAGLECSV